MLCVHFYDCIYTDSINTPAESPHQQLKPADKSKPTHPSLLSLYPLFVLLILLNVWRVFNTEQIFVCWSSINCRSNIDNCSNTFDIVIERWLKLQHFHLPSLSYIYKWPLIDRFVDCWSTLGYWLEECLSTHNPDQPVHCKLIHKSIHYLGTRKENIEINI